jgi:elongator complex protein 2
MVVLAVVLAVGCTDNNVRVWVRSGSLVRVFQYEPICRRTNTLQFVHAAVLSGHEDWVRSLDFLEVAGEPSLILASGSQDATIRLWTVAPWPKPASTHQGNSSETLSDELLDAFEASLGDLGEDKEGGRQISLKRHTLTVKSDQEG